MSCRWCIPTSCSLDHEDALVTPNILTLIITRLPLSSSYAMSVPAITLLIIFCIFLQAQIVEITIVFAV